MLLAGSTRYLSDTTRHPVFLNPGARSFFNNKPEAWANRHSFSSAMWVDTVHKSRESYPTHGDRNLVRPHTGSEYTPHTQRQGTPVAVRLHSLTVRRLGSQDPPHITFLPTTSCITLGGFVARVYAFSAPSNSNTPTASDSVYSPGGLYAAQWVTRISCAVYMAKVIKIDQISKEIYRLRYKT